MVRIVIPADILKLVALSATATLLCPLRASLVDKDAAHGLRRRSEEMAAIRPAWLIVVANKAQVASWTNAVACNVSPGFFPVPASVRPGGATRHTPEAATGLQPADLLAQSPTKDE